MMAWWQALLLGIVQGLTEFLPVSSSGHLMIVRETLGVDAEGFLDFTVAVHCATVLSTLVVFRSLIAKLLQGVFRRGWNDEKDYVGKLLVSMIPVLVVGLFFKDQVEQLFGESLTLTGAGLLATAVLLLASDLVPARSGGNARNGIGWGAAFVTGIGQAFAVVPGLSRSGTTISAGLLTGVRREVMAGFSFLMVLAPILGEQALDLMKKASATESAAGCSWTALALGFVGAFLTGILACRTMVALVKRARMKWFALYCAVLGAAVLWWGLRG